VRHVLCFLPPPRGACVVPRGACSPSLATRTGQVPAVEGASGDARTCPVVSTQSIDAARESGPAEDHDLGRHRGAGGRAPLHNTGETTTMGTMEETVM